MKTIEATYKIVTPMFIGSADQKPDDGIRPPSFKGALRFWWRALHWGKFYQDCDGNETAALKALHQKESELFGSAVKDGKGGQGVFLLSIKQPKSIAQDSSWPSSKPLGQSGFLGMGLWESGDRAKGNFQPHRIGLTSDHPFTVNLCFRGQTSENDIKSIKHALKALGLLGGLGSRSRRGFGSIALINMDEKEFRSDDLMSYKQTIQDLFSKLQVSDVMPPFTAWSVESRIGLLERLQASEKDAHKQAAKLFYQVRGQKAEVRGVSKRGFGQPLPLKPMKKEYDQRRASPLLFHIHPIGNKYICSHIFLPAQFLPHEGSDMNFFNGVNVYMNKLSEVQL